MIDLSNQPSEDQIGAMLDHFSKYVDSEQHPVCPCEEFKTDIDDLCHNCLLKDYISSMISKQILPQIKWRKESFDSQNFAEYLNKQIQLASRAMEEVFLLELQNKNHPKDPYRVNRTMIHIWNREVIKIFTSFLRTDGAAPEPKNKPRILTDKDVKQKVYNIFIPLKGDGPNKKLIMAPADFDRLMGYVEYLALYDKLPDDITPISKANISKGHISYTFYRLHDELFGTKRIKDSFIEFIHKTFGQFADTAPSTTKAKFSNMPKSYKRDLGIDF